ncbi:MAG TPA: sigma-54 dependent transcriptional regulator [Pyrinomonadaceae bacterium]|nr:sigma-54 dependent transcriptional regulator [Pyrinomonadaceae bacterium]
MKSAGALLLDVSATNTLSSELQGILETAFTITVPPNLAQKISSSSATLDEELTQIVRRADAGLIFLIVAEVALDESRDLLAALKRIVPEVPIIVALERCDPEQAFELLSGAADFVTAPFQSIDVLPRAWKALKNFLGEDIPAQEDSRQQQFRQLIGQSPIFLQQAQKISLIASCEANVLIVGETGTGKELYARAIHYGSARAGRPFMPVNCGAIPAELVENELFGHIRGAYTSASSLQIGLIEEANGGTLFLDEIDCLPVHAQVKLLRFLQEKEYRPLGSPKIKQADVRVVAASNLNLEEAVDTGKVRQDLFYRLNIISLTLPPLRDRREDIPLLAHHFLARYSREFDKQVEDFSDEAMNVLMVYSWPGNVRELEHAVERAVVMCNKPQIQAADIVLSNRALTTKRESLREAKAKEIERFEKNYIQGVLSACRGNITRAAEISQKNRRAFWQLIQKYRIDVSRFRPAS